MSETIVSKLKLCKYDIDDIKIFFEDGSTATIPKRNIGVINIGKNFFDMYLPIISIKCTMDEDLYRKINTRKPKYRIVLRKFFIKTDDIHPDLKRPLRSVIFNELLTNINDNDDTVSLSEGIRKEVTKSSDDTRPDIEKDNIEMELFLFKESHMEDYRHLNEHIFRNCNLSSVVMALFQLTKQNRCLMSPIDNSKYFKDSDIIIPNNYSLLGILEYLQSVYGLYDTGYILFRDLDRLYFLSKELTTRAYSKNEYRRIFIKFSDMTSTSGNTYGYLVDNSHKRYIIYNSNQPVINSSGSALSNRLYDEVMLVDTTNGNKDYKQVNYTKANNNKKIKVLDNKYGNKYASNALKYGIELENHTVTMDLDEVDISILTPNKEYYIEFETKIDNAKLLSGLYKLASIDTIIQKKNEESYISKSRVVFKKP